MRELLDVSVREARKARDLSIGVVNIVLRETKRTNIIAQRCTSDQHRGI